jgi:hypothetical protein
MNDLRKYLSTCLLATAALLVGASPAWAQVSLGTASAYSVLGSPVTTTDSAIAGNVGSAGALTLTNSTVTGNVVYSGVLTLTPPSTVSGTSTTPLATQVVADFNGAYAAAKSMHCDHTLLSTITGPRTLAPGVYCTSAALTGTGVLTLDAGGNANAVWIFQIGAALTGTGFSVVMTNGGQPCNVFWAPGAGVTMTTSAFSGTILAGGGTGAITLTGGTLAGRALASGAVTMTGANVIGCAALPSPPPSCKGKDCDEKGKGPGKCKDGKDDDGGHEWGSNWPMGGSSKGDKGKGGW